MAKRIFNYPAAFTTLPDYTAHAGQTVTVTRPMTRGEDYDYEGDGLYEIRAQDGWTGQAFYSELSRIS